ncbi:MAG: sigma-70 family RNA polymerase sigma factor [Firmicutes bacterium]|nr:sigma-70 family RNA polymerase sigma factor [Alicyclobacillaceae bacterium]MCL6497050.1 sigma-70 family RNA polymerase sigma factor [Bacillota bacterium]
MPQQEETSFEVEHWLRQAADGDPAAWHRLTAPVTPVVRRWVATHRVAGLEADDWWQEAAVAVWIAARDYDPSRGGWEAWANWVVRKRLRSALRGALRAKHLALNTALSLDAGLLPAKTALPARDPAARLMARERWRALGRWAREALTPWERRCWLAWLGGVSIADLARRWDAPPKRVDNAIQRARRKLRKAWDPATDRLALPSRRRGR